MIVKNIHKLLKNPNKCLPRFFCQNKPMDLSELKAKFSDTIKVISEKEVEMDQYSLTPHQRWVTQEHNMERAYTGCYYEFAEPGSYDCSCCGSTLFKSEHKYSNESGYASFWASENLAVRDGDNYDMEKWDDTNIIREEFKMPKTDPVKVHCVTCDSFAGLKFKDGPPPSFVRYAINSSSIKYTELQWFENPIDIKERRIKLAREMREREKITFANRVRFDKEKYYDVIDIVEKKD